MNELNGFQSKTLENRNLHTRSKNLNHDAWRWRNLNPYKFKEELIDYFITLVRERELREIFKV